MLYTTDGANQRDSFNLLGWEDNVIATARGTGSSEAWYLYNKDVRGSTSSLIDDSGTVAAAYEYDEFGNTMIRAGEDFDNELCYTGQVYDKETGLYYYNARFYDPEDGRFLTQDTYRGENMEPDTLHLYAYCANNPVNYVDPSGHTFKSLYSTLSKAQKRKLSKKQLNAVKKIPSKKSHFERNKHNTGLPSTKAKAKKRGWKFDFGSAAHQFNQKKKKVGRKRIRCGNVKYKKGRKEVIYYYDGTKNNTPEDRGSYNYASGSGENHTLKDVIPWVAWGNSSTTYGNTENDRTTPKQRIGCTPQVNLSKTAKTAIEALKKLGMYGTVR